jgi:hypothetical protein
MYDNTSEIFSCYSKCYKFVSSKVNCYIKGSDYRYLCYSGSKSTGWKTRRYWFDGNEKYLFYFRHGVEMKKFGLLVIML